jgi:hypothetical protein
VHTPPLWKLTVPLLIEHTLEDEASTVSVTARPDVDVAVALYVAPPLSAAVGAVEVKATVCECFATAKDCCTSVAGE